MPASGGGLFVRTQLLIAYQCSGEVRTDERTGTQVRVPCAWSGLFPVEETLTEADMREWFQCPLHGDGPTTMRKISLSEFRKRRGEGKR